MSDERRPEMPIVYVDTETTGLDHYNAHVWELGAVRVEPDGTSTEACWQIELGNWQIQTADPKALEINGFHRRYKPRSAAAWPVNEVAGQFVALTHGAVLAVANVAFDVPFLESMVRTFGGITNHEMPWHYSPYDVKSAALAVLGLRPPISMNDLLKLYGVELDDSTRHTALGDARAIRLLDDAQRELARKVRMLAGNRG